MTTHFSGPVASKNGFQGYTIGRLDKSKSTVSAVAGASNTSTITIQLKDGAGTNLTKAVPFEVYSSSTADGLTLATAASTGYSVASGGMKRANGNSAVTQGITLMSSATGGCVLSLLDTGKQTSYIAVCLPDGLVISTQLTTGSYG